jgi:hypothetical protein
MRTSIEGDNMGEKNRTFRGPLGALLYFMASWVAIVAIPVPVMGGLLVPSVQITNVTGEKIVVEGSTDVMFEFDVFNNGAANLRFISLTPVQGTPSGAVDDRPMYKQDATWHGPPHVRPI